MSVLRDFRDPYTAVESWGYDHFIAPAVAALGSRLREPLVADLSPGARVLDIGCGGGQNLVAIGEARPDLELVGLDISPEQIERAASRARAAGVRASFVAGSALDLPLDSLSFDAVVSIASIKHWPDPARGVAEALRVLRDGGTLTIVEADRGCHLEDATAFVSGWRIPSPLRPVALAFFRTWVAGRSLDLVEARALLDERPDAEGEVEPLDGLPAWMMSARSRA